MNIAAYIDHTMLSANATKDQINKLCEEAKKYGFASVCVNSCHVSLCYDSLKDSGVNVCTVVGFPLGAASTKAKAFEAENAIKDGANEIDMVINVGALKDKDYEFVEKDIKEVKASCGNKILKVILECCLLTPDEIKKACELSLLAGADYVKTSTGFSTGGAKVEDVKLMRECVKDQMGVKASGGIRDRETALKMIEAGASRLGCSAGVAIVQGEVSNAEY